MRSKKKFRYPYINVYVRIVGKRQVYYEIGSKKLLQLYFVSLVYGKMDKLFIVSDFIHRWKLRISILF